MLAIHVLIKGETCHVCRVPGRAGREHHCPVPRQLRCQLTCPPVAAETSCFPLPSLTKGFKTYSNIMG